MPPLPLLVFCQNCQACLAEAGVSFLSSNSWMCCPCPVHKRRSSTTMPLFCLFVFGSQRWGRMDYTLVSILQGWAVKGGSRHMFPRSRVVVKTVKTIRDGPARSRQCLRFDGRATGTCHLHLLVGCGLGRWIKHV